MKKLKAILCAGMLICASVVMTGCGTDGTQSSNTSSKTVYNLDCCGTLTLNKSNKTFTVSGCSYFSGSGTYQEGVPHGATTLKSGNRKAVLQTSGSEAYIEVQ